MTLWSDLNVVIKPHLKINSKYLASDDRIHIGVLYPNRNVLTDIETLF